MHDIVDLDGYPLDRPESAAWRALVARADLAADGMFNLDGFLGPDAVARAVAQLAPKFATEAFTHARRHNIRFRNDVDGPPADHPSLVRLETVDRTLCADQMAGGVALGLYERPPIARFLAAAMDKAALLTMDDPLARVNAMACGAGEGLNWRFDRSEFTTTLLLQAPAGGGVFEYSTDLRSDDDPNHDGVARLLRGEGPAPRRFHARPGALNVFRGRNTAHRVTPVEGDRQRMIVVFPFFERPGVVFTPRERQGLHGRAE